MTETSRADFDFVVESARRAIASLREDPRLQRREHRDGPGAAMVAHVLALLDQVDEVLAEESSDRGDDVDVGSRSDVVRLLNVFVTREVAACLPWLDWKPRVELPLGVRYLIQEMSRDITHREVEAITMAHTQYATDPRPFLQPVLALVSHGVGVSLPSEEGRTPIVLYYPERAAQSVLLHGLFAHELAHTSLRYEAFVYRLLAPRRQNQTWEREMVDAVRAQVTNAQLPELNAQKEAAVEVLRYWLEEILCDAIAFEVLGPTYLFAFATEALAIPPTDPGPRHPPAVVRVRLMLDQARETWWPALTDSRLSGCDLRVTLQWLADLAERPLPRLSHSRAHLVSVLYEMATEMREMVVAYLRDCRYLPEHYVPFHATLQSYLEQRILPCQFVEPPTGRPGGAVDRRAILLAAWLYLLTSQGDSPKTLGQAFDQREMQGFVTRALEMSRVLEEWVGNGNT